MEKKQTAVEWLYSIVKIEYPEFNDTVLWLALHKEKEQITDAYAAGYPEFIDIAEQYYNQTYGNG